MIFGNFDVIETSRTFNIRAVGAVDDHNIVPVGDDRVDFGLIELGSGFEVDGVGVVIFDRDIIFTGFEIRAEGTACGDELGSVFGGAEGAREGGHSELLQGFFNSDGFFGFALRKRSEAGLLAGRFFVVAKLDEATVATDFGINWAAGFGVFAEFAGVIITGGVVGFDDFFFEWAIEIAKHFDAFEFVLGDFIEVFFDVGGEFIINDIVEIVGQEAG